MFIHDDINNYAKCRVGKGFILPTNPQNGGHDKALCPPYRNFISQAFLTLRIDSFAPAFTSRKRGMEAAARSEMA